MRETKKINARWKTKRAKNRTSNGERKKGINTEEEKKRNDRREGGGRRETVKR